MLKKTLYSLIAIVFIGVIAWEYKVNILIWSIPKVAAVFMPFKRIFLLLGQRAQKL